MIGYVPQIFPTKYIQTRTAFNGLGALNSSPLSLVGGLLANAFSAPGQGTQAFFAEQQQLDAEALASQRSRRWAAFGAVAVGVAGLAGVVYLLKGRK